MSIPKAVEDFLRKQNPIVTPMLLLVVGDLLNNPDSPFYKLIEKTENLVASARKRILFQIDFDEVEQALAALQSPQSIERGHTEEE